jgi:hypothetical protein
VWGKNGSGDFGCVVENSLKCDDYLTISGCTWSDATDNNLKMICEWSNETTRCSNSAKCENLKEASLLCESYTSDNGRCFYNGENEVTVLEKSCSNILDVTNCEFFKSMSVCGGASKETYLNLPSPLEFPCIWDMKKEGCNSQNIPQIEDDRETDPAQSSSFVLIIIIIVGVVVVVLITVIVIVIIILYKRKMNRNLRNVTDSSNMKESEMESLKASGLSSSTAGQKIQRKISLCISFYFTYSFFV